MVSKELKTSLCLDIHRLKIRLSWLESVIILCYFGPISAESSRLVRSAHLLESLSAACLWWPLHGVPSHSKGKRWVLTKTRAQEMTLSMLLLVLYKEMKRLITSLSNKGNWNIEQSGAAYRSIDILTYIKGGEGVLLGDWGRGFRFLHTICSPLSP